MEARSGEADRPETTAVTIVGTIHADGSLELEGRVDLPPGQVQVTLTPCPARPPDDAFWKLLNDIWAGQKARGHVPRAAIEIEAERRIASDSWEQRMTEIAYLQAEASRLRSRERPFR